MEHDEAELPADRSAPAAPGLAATRPDSCPFDQDETYPRPRAYAPLSPVRCPAGMDAWLVSRYEDVREVLTDPRLSSRGAGNAPALPCYDPRDPVPGWMFSLDGAGHARLRRLLVGEFTGRRRDALRPRVQDITDEHMDAMLTRSSADLVRDLAPPIPSLVTCEVLGVPRDHLKAVQRDSEALSSFETDAATGDGALARMQGCSLRGGRAAARRITRRPAEPADRTRRRDRPAADRGTGRRRRDAAGHRP
ncbi:hypothetical protein ABZ896_17365 [Streptomyces sp. NPDC047072]|uniref:hypothetical protein n=1 Tax=Streptomyces sp. NPDC047072 TaxID=3154809 RepID=UPI00340DFD74